MVAFFLLTTLDSMLMQYPDGQVPQSEGHSCDRTGRSRSGEKSRSRSRSRREDGAIERVYTQQRGGGVLNLWEDKNKKRKRKRK